MRKKTAVLFLSALPVLFSLTACLKTPESSSEFAFNTLCTITLYGGRPAVFREIFERLRELENSLSIHIEGSDIDRINRAAGIEAVTVNDDVYFLIERALFFADLSGGAFDPGIGPVVSLWGITGDNPRLPAEEEINKALALVNRHEIILDPVTKSVFLAKPGMMLDLGAIAKGYAADEAALIIKKAKIKQAIIDLGGNILCVGSKQDNQPWNIGIQNPYGDRGVSLGYVRTGEKSIVSSGVYERFFEHEGERYHHIFNPADGFPVKNGLLSVTIISTLSLDADALSTAVFVLGFERGMKLIESFPDTEAVFVFDDYSIAVSEGADFILTDNDYKIKN